MLQVCQSDDIYIAAIHIDGAFTIDYTAVICINIALIVIRVLIIVVLQLNIRGVDGHIAADRRRIRCTGDIFHMRTMSIDSNATTNIATDGAIDFRNIIPLVVISRRVYTLIPAPDILIGVDRNVAVYRIIALNAGIGCKAIACADNRPVAT